MKKNLFKALTIIMALMFILCSCNSNASSSVNSGVDSVSSEDASLPSEKNYVIGVSMKTLSDQFPKAIADAIEAKAEELGNVEIIMTDAQADVATQLSQVENLIAQNVDAIILNAQDANGLGSAVDACVEAGIPVIECNTKTENENYVTYVGSSDVEAGRLQGEFIKEALGGEGQVAIMYGAMGQSGQIGRKQGVDEALLNVCPDIELVADQTADWQRDEAMRLAEDWLLRFPELDAIMCQNDDMAMGAIQAVEAAGKQDEVLVVGVDAISDALQAVKSGQLACTVFQNAEGQGIGALEAAIQVIDGETLDKEILIPFELVTQENVDEFIA